MASNPKASIARLRTAMKAVREASAECLNMQTEVFELAAAEMSAVTIDLKKMAGNSADTTVEN